MSKLLFFSLAVFSVLLFMQFSLQNYSSNIYEPKYKVIKEFNKFEIRLYQEMFVASSTMNTKTYNESSSNGFRRVAGYIFGGNKSNQKIAMTSPVFMDMDESVTMSFVMPPNINKSNAPEPNDDRVKLNTRPSEKLAVIRFGGWASDSKLKEKYNQLKKLLNKEGIEYFGGPIYMGYNPPYQLINRKNEIAIRVKY
jgi:hypothetical protein